MVAENQFSTLLLLINQPVMKNTKNQESNFLKKINRRVLSHIMFYLEDDGYRPVDFNNETVSFTYQPIKI